MDEMIAEIKELINEQLSIRTDNAIEEQYKSRTISNYAAALRSLMEVERIENNGKFTGNHG